MTRRVGMLEKVKIKKIVLETWWGGLTLSEETKIDQITTLLNISGATVLRLLSTTHFNILPVEV